MEYFLPGLLVELRDNHLALFGSSQSGLWIESTLRCEKRFLAKHRWRYKARLVDLMLIANWSMEWFRYALRCRSADMVVGLVRGASKLRLLWYAVRDTLNPVPWIDRGIDLLVELDIRFSPLPGCLACASYGALILMLLALGLPLIAIHTILTTPIDLILRRTGNV